jgi:hypothetical protein
MDAYSLAGGSRTRCMGKANSHGTMAAHMKENILMIRSMERESSAGLMVEFTMVSGQKVDNMVSANTPQPMDAIARVSGLMARESSGSVAPTTTLGIQLSKKALP